MASEAAIQWRASALLAVCTKQPCPGQAMAYSIDCSLRPRSSAVWTADRAERQSGTVKWLNDERGMQADEVRGGLSP